MNNSNALEHITHIRNLDNSVESFTHFITALVMNKVLPERRLRVKQNFLPWAREAEVCEARIKRNLAHQIVIGGFGQIIVIGGFDRPEHSSIALFRSFL